jgi:hypothetical protein
VKKAYFEVVAVKKDRLDFDFVGFAAVENE